MAEVAGYLWQKGWASATAGNITINVTECIDDAVRALPSLSDPIPFGMALPRLKGCYFFCKGDEPPDARPGPPPDGERRG